MNLLELRPTYVFSCFYLKTDRESQISTKSTRRGAYDSWLTIQGAVTTLKEADPEKAWAVLKHHFPLAAAIIVPTANETDPAKSWAVLKQTRPKTVRRIVCISDTHNLHADMPPLPLGDILIHAGDFTDTGTLDEIEDFTVWFSKQPHQYKVLLAGNHDILLDKACVGLLGGIEATQFRKDFPKARKLVEGNPHFSYLEAGDPVNFGGVRIAGFPHLPKPANWVYAFGRKRGSALRKEWDRIPGAIDVLVTHGPPAGICDQSHTGQHYGCVDLLWAVTQRVKPKLHVFGHVHSSYGATSLQNGVTTFLNVSTCDGEKGQYQPSNPPSVIDIEVGSRCC